MHSKINLLKDRATSFKGRQRIDEHELDVYLVKAASAQYDSTLAEDEPAVELVIITPTPRVVSKPLSALTDRDGEGALAVSVHRYEVSDVSRINHSEDQLREVLYYLVVTRGTVIDPLLVPKGQYKRYKLSGAVEMWEKSWRLMLEEMK